MASFDRSTMMATFHQREQAEQAIAALKQAGFSDEQVGLAGRQEVFAEVDPVRSAPVESERPDLIVVAVKAEDRYQQALDILKNYEVVEVHSSPFEQTAEHIEPMVSSNFGLHRDPALDEDVTVGDNNAGANRVVEQEGGDTFFGQTVLPGNASPGDRNDPDIHQPRTV